MSTLQNVTIHILDFFTYVMRVTLVGIDTHFVVHEVSNGADYSHWFGTYLKYLQTLPTENNFSPQH